MFRSGRLLLLARASGLATPFYRVCFLAGLSTSGLLEALRNGPGRLEELADRLGVEPGLRSSLEAWLDFGVRLGELRRGPGGYSLRSSLAKHLAEPEHDDVAALFEEIASMHHLFITQLPARLSDGALFTLQDQDGTIVARSSRTLEPLVREAVDQAVPIAGPLRLLEVGCGSGVYLRHAALRNPELSALGLELQPEVAEVARRNLADWGITGRIRVEQGDVRDLHPGPNYDLVTLHNNIYYFPMEERVELLRHLRGFLRSGGSLLLTTGCRGGTPVMEMLNLWGAATQGCGPLPAPEEQVEQLREAGYSDVRATSLVPGDRYYFFLARNPDGGKSAPGDFS